MKNSNNSSFTEPGNESQSTPQTKAVCPVCNGAGYLREDVPLGHPSFGKIHPCPSCQQPRLQEQHQADLRSVSNLEAMGRYTFDTFLKDGVGLTEEKQRNLNNVFEACRRFADRPEGWLVLLGGYGCGKTHLAVAIANQQLAQSKPALFVVVPDLLDYLRSTYSPHSAVTYDERFEAIRNSPLLILDDLGTHSSTAWAREKLFQIFNHRYNARLTTVITTNQRLEDIDTRIRSRLTDPDLAQIFTITAPDFRGSGSEQIGYELSSLSLHSDQTFETFSLRKQELSQEQRHTLEQAFEFCRNYAAHPEDWVVLTGGYGCGKTHLAAAIANDRAQKGHQALFVVVPDLLDHLRATYAPDSLVSYDDRLDEVRSVPMLVLDDLGTQSATPWAQEKLYQIINHRYNARLATVFTLTDDVNIEERLKSRLFDRGRCTNLRINAPSYRGSEVRARQRPATNRKRS